MYTMESVEILESTGGSSCRQLCDTISPELYKSTKTWKLESALFWCKNQSNVEEWEKNSSLLGIDVQNSKAKVENYTSHPMNINKNTSHKAFWVLRRKALYKHKHYLINPNSIPMRRKPGRSFHFKYKEMDKAGRHNLSPTLSLSLLWEVLLTPPLLSLLTGQLHCWMLFNISLFVSSIQPDCELLEGELLHN